MEHVAGMPVTDDGKRLSEAVKRAIAAGGRERWLAVRLSDGGTDGNIYDTRKDAVRHQLHESQCFYVLVPPGGDMPAHEATAFIEFHRRREAAGFNMVDPEDQAPMPLMAPATGIVLPPGVVPNRKERRGNRTLGPAGSIGSWGRRKRS